MEIIEKVFGQTQSEKTIKEYTIFNNYLKIKVINYGAILAELHVADRKGKFDDIILGFDNLEGYLNDDTCQGATIGRYANRIAKATFEIDGKKYNLTKNDGENHIHGGPKGFNKVVWDAQRINRKNIAGIKFKYFSRNGEENYPGNLKATVSYLLSDRELIINFTGETDQKTPLNMTHHSYFNLRGPGKGDILDHNLKIHGGHYLPVDDNLIPTGEVKPVADTPMDFTEFKKIGKEINQLSEGYDHNWVLDNENGDLILAAELYEERSGRKMALHTTKPGLQFYSGNFLDGSLKGKQNVKYKKHYGLCLEPQFYPDSPNQPEFPFSFLTPDKKYEHQIRLIFTQD